MPREQGMAVHRQVSLGSVIKVQRLVREADAVHGGLTLGSATPRCSQLRSPGHGQRPLDVPRCPWDSAHRRYSVRFAEGPAYEGCMESMILRELLMDWLCSAQKRKG
jgi:hypothetical protein